MHWRCPCLESRAVCLLVHPSYLAADTQIFFNGNFCTCRFCSSVCSKTSRFITVLVCVISSAFWLTFMMFQSALQDFLLELSMLLNGVSWQFLFLGWSSVISGTHSLHHTEMKSLCFNIYCDSPGLRLWSRCRVLITYDCGTEELVVFRILIRLQNKFRW
jgi:hypothetical protein